MPELPDNVEDLEEVPEELPELDDMPKITITWHIEDPLSIIEHAPVTVALKFVPDIEDMEKLEMFQSVFDILGEDFDEALGH